VSEVNAMSQQPAKRLSPDQLSLGSALNDVSLKPELASAPVLLEENPRPPESTLSDEFALFRRRGKQNR